MPELFLQYSLPLSSPCTYSCKERGQCLVPLVLLSDLLHDSFSCLQDLTKISTKVLEKCFNSKLLLRTKSLRQLRFFCSLDIFLKERNGSGGLLKTQREVTLLN